MKILPEGITEEMVKKYGGISHICYMAFECNFAGDSPICRLLDGAKHPDCPARIQRREEWKEEIAKDPEVQKLIAKHDKLVAERLAAEKKKEKEEC